MSADTTIAEWAHNGDKRRHQTDHQQFSFLWISRERE
jgi:hypothetical protein